MYNVVYLDIIKFKIQEYNIFVKVSVQVIYGKVLCVLNYFMLLVYFMIVCFKDN